MKDGMIIKGNWTSFLGLKGEELLLVQRRHIFLLVYPIFLNFLIFLIFSAAAYFIFSYVLPSLPLLILSLLLMLCVAISLSIYTAVYWYFHLYILTNRKILEVKYTPLFSHVVNDIFLDKVNCTEIDLSSKGFFHELIDLGDVTITFDRPTHQEEFVLQDIKNCDEIGKFLTQKLMDGQRERLGDTIWFRSRSNLVPKTII
jgi:membrane-associated HD superfamily phosphohydrolase